jgi:energy-converting hydrogenase Eha subunit A
VLRQELVVQLAEVQAMLVAQLAEVSGLLSAALANFSHKGDSHGR